MHFTLVFESDESHDSSYGLVFIPCPVWVQGNAEIANLRHPNYIRGDLKPLLQNVGRAIRTQAPRHVVCVVHPEGIGTRKHFENLLADLEEASFQVTVVEMGAPTGHR